MAEYKEVHKNLGKSKERMNEVREIGKEFLNLKNKSDVIKALSKEDRVDVEEAIWIAITIGQAKCSAI